MKIFKYKILAHWHDISGISFDLKTPILAEHCMSYEPLTDLLFWNWVEQNVITKFEDCNNVMKANVTWLLTLLHVVPR